MIERRWVEAPKPIPQGVARAWVAAEGGVALAGIFEVITGGKFMLSYHVLGEQKPRVEEWYSFDAAKDRASAVLSGCKVIPRAIRGLN